MITNKLLFFKRRISGFCHLDKKTKAEQTIDRSMDINIETFINFEDGIFAVKNICKEYNVMYDFKVERADFCEIPNRQERAKEGVRNKVKSIINDSNN